MDIINHIHFLLRVLKFHKRTLAYGKFKQF